MAWGEVQHEERRSDIFARWRTRARVLSRARTSCSCPCTPKWRPSVPRTSRARRIGSIASAGMLGLVSWRGFAGAVQVSRASISLHDASRRRRTVTLPSAVERLAARLGDGLGRRYRGSHLDLARVRRASRGARGVVALGASGDGAYNSLSGTHREGRRSSAARLKRGSDPLETVDLGFENDLARSAR